MALDQKIIEELKQQLVAQKNQLESELSRIGDPTDTSGDYQTRFNEIGPDEDENASEVEEYTDNLALENSLEKQFKEVNEALSRIENGTYGKCSKCGKDINLERLRAYSAAKTCTEC